MKEAVKLKKEAFPAWMAQGSPEAADRYWEARRDVASVVREAKIWLWEEFGEAMEKDFRLASGLSIPNLLKVWSKTLAHFVI